MKETEQVASVSPEGGALSLMQPTNDLADGLFTKNCAMASVVRELQERNMRANLAKTANDLDAQEPACTKGNGRAISSSVADVESGNGSALWVLGGATTVADRSGIPADAAGLAQHAKALPEESEPQVASSVDLAQPADGHAKAESPKHRSRSRMRAFSDEVREACQALGEIIYLYPGTLVAPLVIFLVLSGVGIWGVIAGSHAHVQQRKDDARSRAVDAATGFQIQLQQSFTPGTTFTLLVKQRYDLEYWIQNFNATAAELMTRVPNGSLWNLQLQPFGQVMMIYPYREADITQVAPPRDLLADPGRRDDILKIIRTRQAMLVGPFNLSDYTIGAFVRYPIFISDVGPEETFGFRYFYPGANDTSPLPYDQLPASVRNCSDCYNATSREKWWGLMTVLINYDAVTYVQDAYLANLRKMGFHYALVVLAWNGTEQIVAQVGPSSLHGQDAVTIDFTTFNRQWILRVAPAGGFAPSWKGPLIAAVIVVSLVISSLLFIAAASFRRQRLLLNETVAANRNLAETTKRLEEEKERMDVLLVRQYDLLRCLDANRGSKGDSDALGTSRRAMMARIEDARRSLNVVKASLDDSIQVFEVLGAGAFGKVQKGLWRGTVVAVKTMILPANMTGQEKREKMAVMEAAISSSLVHPNIVTTYTYFIRPYHEPSHGGVRHMLPPSASSLSKEPPPDGSHGSLEDSTVSESTIHSYEVRLVLEFCDKGSLKDALEQHAFMKGVGLNLAAMLETAADVAKAMVHMHASNVLHSDIKARNIMLKSSGTEGRGVVAKVADFGLSTRMEHQETHLSSCFQGTLTHMAPEVMLEGRISKAADVYSFGILMWELFCAGDPFAGVPRAHLGHAITKEARRPKFPPFAPRDYVALASRCWDPDAALRPSFEEVLAELGRMREELGGETEPLHIVPPQPITPNPSAEGAARRTPVTSHDGGGSLGSVEGIVLGPASTIHSGGGAKYAAAGVAAASSGAKGSNVVLTLDASQATGGSRSRMKNLVAARHLRKLGIRMGSTGLAQTLPALQEDAEHREPP